MKKQGLTFFSLVFFLSKTKNTQTHTREKKKQEAGAMTGNFFSKIRHARIPVIFSAAVK